MLVRRSSKEISKKVSLTISRYATLFISPTILLTILISLN
jgi:hypothetical protein